MSQTDVSAGTCIVVIHHTGRAAAERLKALIEFMDAPPVVVAHADHWVAQFGKRRLAAVFVNDDLEREQVDKVFGEVRAFDPNTPIVVIKSAAEVA